jgi:hypothetical protein
MAANVSIPEMTQFLTEFSSFKNRYYQSTYGAESAQWLYNQIESLAKSADASKVKVSLKKFEHPWTQFSTIARIEAVDGLKAAKKAKKMRGKKYVDETPIVILGAHQDCK